MGLWVLVAVFALHAVAQAPDNAVGRKIFESQCALCHGQTGGGGRGPALNRPKLDRAPDDAALRKFISEGGGDMPGAWQLHADELAGVAAYVPTLGTMPPETVPVEAPNGARGYANSRCAGSHVVGLPGAGLGPQLTTIS